LSGVTLAVGAPFGEALGRGVEARVDGHGPVEAAHRLAQAQHQQVFEGALEDAGLVGQGHRAVPLHEAHAHVELQGPVGLGGDHAGVHVEVVVALVADGEVALGLAGDVLEGLAGQRSGVAEDEALLDAQGPVGPGPAAAEVVTFLGQGEVLRVVGRQVFHQQLEGVPLGQHHVGQHLAAAGVALQGDGPVAAFGDVVLIHIEGPQIHVARAAAHMGLDVDAVHVLVFREGEGKAQDGGVAVAVAVVAAEGFFGLEGDAHVGLL
jgi:hypothetical protein